MDMCGFSCLVCLITACRCATEVVATLFLTQRSPSPVAHRTVLIARLWFPVPGSALALKAQTRPLLWHHILVANALPCLLPDYVRDTPGLGVSHHWPVDEQF